MVNNPLGPVSPEAPTLEQLREIVTQAVVDALGKGVCRSPLSDEQIKESLHVFGMLEDIGDGDLARGVETVRANHKWVMKVRRKGESVGTAIIVLVLGTIATGILAAMWAGIKSLIGSRGG